MEAMERLERLARMGRPCLFMGPPGVGKTALVRQFIERHEGEFHHLPAYRLDPYTIGGLPAHRDGRTVIGIPEWADRLNRAAAEGRMALLLIDELTTAAPSQQTAALTLLSDRLVGDQHLHDGVTTWAAANPPDQASGGFVLEPPMISRLVVVPWEQVFGMEDWLQSFPDWCASRSLDRAMAQAVTEFLRMHPEHFSAPPREATMDPYPCPRSWEAAVAALTCNGHEGTPWTRTLLSGCVGPRVAAEFLRFLAARDALPPEELLRGAPLPSRLDQALAALDGLVAWAAQRPVQRAPEAVACLERLAGEGTWFPQVIQSLIRLITLEARGYDGADVLGLLENRRVLAAIEEVACG